MKTSISRILTLTVALLVSAGPALATPVLRTDITVNTPIVTVGDMFEDAGSFAEQPLFRAPAPGTVGQVSVAAVTTAAARVGLSGFDNSGILAVRVARFGIHLGETEISDLITTEVRNRGFIPQGAIAETRFDTALPDLQAGSAESPAQLMELRFVPASGQFLARIDIAGRPLPFEISGNINLLVEVPHLAAAQPAGKVLTADDIEMRPVPLSSADTGSFATLDQVIGKQLRRPARDGLMLRPADLQEPVIVARNDAVTIYLRSGPMTLTVRGQALGDAARGERVSVLNLMSSKVISGIAVDAGAVEVGTSNLTLSSL